MEPALLRSPPPVGVGRRGTDLFISNPARLHSQRDIALKVWDMEMVKDRVRYLNLIPPGLSKHSSLLGASPCRQSLILKT